jgi:hypothetical protein
MGRAAILEVRLDLDGEPRWEGHDPGLVALAPHFDGALVEIQVVDPHATQLDATQAEPLGQRQGQAVEQRVPAGGGQLAQQGGLFDGEAAAPGLGPSRLPQAHGDVGRGVALLHEVAPQMAVGGHGVLLGRSAGPASLVGASLGQDMLGDEVGQVAGREAGRGAVGVGGDEAAGPGPVGVLGALGRQRQGAGFVALDGLGHCHRRRSHGARERIGSVSGAEEVEDPADHRRVAADGQDVEGEARVGQGLGAPVDAQSFDDGDDVQQRSAEVAQAGQLGADALAQCDEVAHREITSHRRAKSSTGTTRIPPSGAGIVTASNAPSSSTASQVRIRRSSTIRPRRSTTVVVR